MSNIEKIRQEIERRKKVCLTKNGFPTGTFGAIKIETYEGLLAFIDSLPEEKPSEDLEEAVEEYRKRVSDGHNYRDLTCGFIAGAEWQKEQMMKEAVEGFIFQSEDYYPKELVAQYNGELKHGDKVKIIIVKEDDKG